MCICDVGPSIGIQWIESHFIGYFSQEPPAIGWIPPESLRLSCHLATLSNRTHCTYHIKVKIYVSLIGKNNKVPPEVRFCSFQLFTTSSHVTSVLTRWMMGSLGFLVARRNPLCLKLTISPAMGIYLLLNSEVATGAVNWIPSGLLNKGEKVFVWHYLHTKVVEGTIHIARYSFVPQQEILSWPLHLWISKNCLDKYKPHTHAHTQREREREREREKERNKYFVFQITRTSARLIRCFWIPQDDTLPSFIHYVLKELLKVWHIPAHLESCQLNMWYGVLA